MTATRDRLAPAGRGAKATPFTSIWDWINTVNANGMQNITSTDLSVEIPRTVARRCSTC